MAIVLVAVAWFVAASIVVEVVIVVVVLVVLEFLDVHILKWIMSLFGIVDKDVIAVSVTTQKIISNPEVQNALMTQLSLQHQADPNNTVISKFATLTQRTKGYTRSFYNTGVSDYTPGLPTTNMRSSNVPISIVEPIISVELGQSVVVKSSAEESMYKEAWCFNLLEASNSYSIISNSLLIGGVTYVVDNIDYNYTTNKYDVHCSSFHNTSTDTMTTTVVTITNIDATTDSKHTVVTDDITVTSSIDGLLPTYSVVVSDITEVVPIGSVSGSSTSTTTTGVTATNVFRDNQIISVAAYSPEIYIIAEYYLVGDSPDNLKYWLYRLADATYATLDNANGTMWQSTSFFPIIPLRSDFVNFNANKASVQYKETMNILNTLGVSGDTLTDAVNSNPNISDISSVHVHLSINLSESTPEIDKLTYMTFSQLYEDSGLYTEADKLGGNTGSYTATITQGTFNQALTWSSQTKAIVTGSIGAVGTYQKTTAGNDLVIRYQATATDYIEYQIINVAIITFIRRAGLADTVGQKLSEGNVEVPLSFFIVDQLDPMEQSRLYPYILKISFYAAQITHLEWYETPEFASFIKIVAIIVAIVIIVLSWGSASSLSAFLVDMAMNIGIGLAVTFAMKQLMASGAPDWLKAVGAVVIIALAMYTGASFNSGESLSATQLTSAVTTASTTTIIGTTAGIVSMGAQAIAMNTSYKMEQLKSQDEKFSSQSDQRLKSFTAAEDLLKMGGVIDTSIVVDLVNKEVPEAYLPSIDAFYYKAKGSLQYEYGTLFNYGVHKDDFVSNKLRMGVI